MGLAPIRQTQKEQYAYPDVTSPNRLHSDPDVGEMFLRGQERKEKKQKKRKNTYIDILYILLYFILYIILYIIIYTYTYFLLLLFF